MTAVGIPAFDRIPGQETDVCLIVEGCYPHITGGVSSWLDWLMRNLPQCSFSVVSLVSGDEVRASKYTFPPNLLRFAEINLKGPPKKAFAGHFKANAELAEAFAEQLTRLLQQGGADVLGEVLSILDRFPRCPTYHNLTRSEFAWQVVCSMYRRMMPEASFIDYFWAWQSLVGGLFSTLLFPLPPARNYHAISTGYAGLLAARAAVERGARAIVTEHGIYTNERRIEILTADWIEDTIDNGLAVENRRKDLRDLWIDTFESYARTCYDACEKITTLYSDNQKLQLDMGAEYGKLTVIPNGIDLKRFGSLTPEPTARPTVALIGRVVPIKDVKTFIASAQAVRDAVPDVCLLVLGPLDEDKEYADECRAMIEDMDLEETVVLAGRVNVLEWLPKIQVMVLSSLSEAQPLTVLEAGAAGIPCVTTNVGSCREILHGTADENPAFGMGGIVTDVVAPDQIAEGVIKLLRDDQLRRQMGENLRARVHNLYSSELSRDAYARLYGQAEGREAARWQA
ncbi:GT4 family glycosyltransferase PelF [Mesorhizobium sp. ASY16-5R]|uniref:GT4 family glycosyltransferase PelF n=1 Tax=Mesorhizobium sp. ASY16-5R TaxID=3445772 RepID=UPI003FA0A24F